MATNKKPKNQSRHSNWELRIIKEMRGKQIRVFKGELSPMGHSPKTLLKRIAKNAIETIEGGRKIKNELPNH